MQSFYLIDHNYSCKTALFGNMIHYHSSPEAVSGRTGYMCTHNHCPYLSKQSTII
jgi:hypothetical protein